MSVNWTETAAAQLQAVRDFIARGSPGYAQALAERVIRRTELLAEFPRLGAKVPEYGDESIRELFEHPVRIVYRVTGDAVEVVAVIHASRRMPRTPP
jgi:plasmid stabilization system protein ParE